MANSLSRDEHRIQDLALLEQRIGLGDQLDAARNVEHFAYFRKHPAAETAANELHVAGFTISMTRLLRRTEVVATKKLDVLPETVEATVTQVFDIVTAVGGLYDGWGSEVVVPEAAD